MLNFVIAFGLTEFSIFPIPTALHLKTQNDIGRKRRTLEFCLYKVNDAFEHLTGLKRENGVGRKVTEAISGIGETNPELFNICGRVSKTGKEEKFEVFFETLKTWLSMSLFQSLMPNEVDLGQRRQSAAWRFGVREILFTAYLGLAVLDSPDHNWTEVYCFIGKAELFAKGYA